MSTNICVIALTLLLMVAFRFQALISTMFDSKEIVQFKNQSWLLFLWQGRIYPVMIHYVNIFTNNESLIQDVIRVLPISYQNNTKCREKRNKFWVSYNEMHIMYKLFKIHVWEKQRYYMEFPWMCSDKNFTLFSKLG